MMTMMTTTTMMMMIMIMNNLRPSNLLKGIRTCQASIKSCLYRGQRPQGVKRDSSLNRATSLFLQCYSSPIVESISLLL
jgi:hypothetical protein